MPRKTWGQDKNCHGKLPRATANYFFCDEACIILISYACVILLQHVENSWTGRNPFREKKLLVEGNWSQLGRFHLFPVKDYSRWRRTLGNIDIVLSYITLLYKICYWDHFVNFSNHSRSSQIRKQTSVRFGLFSVLSDA